jgi:hypothetical protein
MLLSHILFRIEILPLHAITIDFSLEIPILNSVTTLFRLRATYLQFQSKESSRL